MARSSRRTQKKTPSVTTKPSVVVPTSRFSRVRQSLRQTFSTTKRKALAVGLAGAIALGSYGAYKGIQTYRFNLWKQNASVTVGLSRHLLASDFEPIATELRNAQRSNKPYHFLIMESASMTHDRRQKAEKFFESEVQKVRSELLRDPSPQNRWRVKQLLMQQMSETNSPESLGFTSELMLVSAEHGLTIKLAEERSEKESQKILQASETQKKIAGKVLQTPTNQLKPLVRQFLDQKKVIIEARNHDLVEGVSRSTAEFRKEYPSFRSTPVRSLMIVGAGHAGVVPLLEKEKVPKRTVDSKDFFDTDSSLVTHALLDWERKGGKLSDPALVDRFSVILPIETIHDVLAQRHPTVAKKLRDRVDQLSSAEVARLLKLVENKTGHERSQELIKQLTGVELVLYAGS